MRMKLLRALVLSLFAFSVWAQPTADDATRPAIDVLAGPDREQARYCAFPFDVERDGKTAVAAGAFTQ